MLRTNFGSPSGSSRSASIHGAEEVLTPTPSGSVPASPGPHERPVSPNAIMGRRPSFPIDTAVLHPGNADFEKNVHDFSVRHDLDADGLRTFLKALFRPTNFDAWQLQSRPQLGLDLKRFDAVAVEPDEVMQQLLATSSIPAETPRDKFIRDGGYKAYLDKDSQKFMGMEVQKKFRSVLAYLEENPHEKEQERKLFAQNFVMGASDLGQCGMDEPRGILEAITLLELGQLRPRHRMDLRLQQRISVRAGQYILNTFDSFFNQLGIDEENRGVYQRLRETFLETGTCSAPPEMPGSAMLTLAFDPAECVSAVQEGLRQDWGDASGTMGAEISGNETLRKGNLNRSEFVEAFLNLEMPELNLLLQTDSSVIDLLCRRGILARCSGSPAAGAGPRINHALGTLLAATSSCHSGAGLDIHQLLLSTTGQQLRNINDSAELQTLVAGMPRQSAVSLLLEMADQKSAAALDFLHSSAFCTGFLHHSRHTDFPRWRQMAAADGSRIGQVAANAAEAGNVKLFELLVNSSDIDISCEDQSGCSVLQHILGSGREDLFAQVLGSAHFHNAFNTRTEDGGASVLQRALGSGNMALFQAVLDQCKAMGHDLNEKNQDGLAAIHLAIGLPFAINALISNGADLNLPSGRTGHTPVMLTTEDGDIESLRLLIAAGADVNRVTEGTGGPGSKLSATMIAARDGQDAALQMLLDAGARIDDRNINGNSALQFAVQRAFFNAVKLLAGRGAKLDDCDKNGHTAVSLAVVTGHEEILQLLIDQGAPINAQVREQPQDQHALSPAMLAIIHGHLGVLKILLRHGADIAEKNSAGETVLRVAIKSDRMDILEYTLAHLADSGGCANDHSVDGGTKSAIVLACHLSHGKALKTLIEAGFGFDEPDHRGRRPAMIAANINHLDALQILLEARGPDGQRVDINAFTKEGNYALRIATMRGHVDAMTALLRAGASTAPSGTARSSPVFEAIKSKKTESLKVLLEAGADIDMPGENQMTPALLAIDQGSTELLQLLIDHDADLNIPLHYNGVDNYSLAMHAVDRNEDLALQMLIGAGADTDRADSRGMTPAMAAAHRNAAVLKLLLDAGANPDAQDNNGHSLLQIYLQVGTIGGGIMRAMLESGASVCLRDHAGNSLLRELAEGDLGEVLPAQLQLLILKKALSELLNIELTSSQRQGKEGWMQEQNLAFLHRAGLALPGGMEGLNAGDLRRAYARVPDFDPGAVPMPEAIVYRSYSYDGGE